MEITETTEWMTSFGKQFHMFVMLLVQMFMIAEFVMYIILFKDQYNHNKELQNGNSLGLSADTLHKRQKKNVITLFGQCFIFGFEIVMSFTLQLASYMNFSPFNINLFFTSKYSILEKGIKLKLWELFLIGLLTSIAITAKSTKFGFNWPFWIVGKSKMTLKFEISLIIK